MGMPKTIRMPARSLILLGLLLAIGANASQTTAGELKPGNLVVYTGEMPLESLGGTQIPKGAKLRVSSGILLNPGSGFKGEDCVLLRFATTEAFCKNSVNGRPDHRIPVRNLELVSSMTQVTA